MSAQQPTSIVPLPSLPASLPRDGYGAITPPVIGRNGYSALSAWLSWGKNILSRLSSEVDEHGWRFGIENVGKFGKGGYHAVNFDWYGLSFDLHDGKPIGVVQVREAFKAKASHFASVHKNYFLIGTNEDETPFAHAVGAAKIHAAIRSEKCVVKAAQDWIFGTDYARVVRQGDLALIPTRRPLGEPNPDGDQVKIAGSHEVEADEIRTHEKKLYAKNPRAFHIPQTHPVITGEGWFEIRLGRREPTWDFSKTKID